MVKSLLVLLVALTSVAASAQETLYIQRFDEGFAGEGFTWQGGSYQTGVFDSPFALDRKTYRLGSGSLRVGTYDGDLRATHHLDVPLEEGAFTAWVNFSESYDTSTMVVLHTMTLEGEIELARVSFDSDGHLRPFSPLLQPHVEVASRAFTVRPGWYEVTLHQSAGTLTAYIGSEKVARWYSRRPWSAFSLARKGTGDAVAWFDEVEIYTGALRIAEPDAAPARRSGILRVGLGGGVGLARLSLGGVDFTNELEAAAAMHLAMSYSRRPGLRWVLESTAWPSTFAVRDQRLKRWFGLTAVSVMWFPDESPLLLRAGAGLAYVDRAIPIPEVDESDPSRETHGLGLGLTAGVGYEVPVTPRLAATVQFQYARLDLGEDSAVDLFSFQAGARFALNRGRP